MTELILRLVFLIFTYVRQLIFTMTLIIYNLHSKPNKWKGKTSQVERAVPTHKHSLFCPVSWLFSSFSGPRLYWPWGCSCIVDIVLTHSATNLRQLCCPVVGASTSAGEMLLIKAWSDLSVQNTLHVRTCICSLELSLLDERSSDSLFGSSVADFVVLIVILNVLYLTIN